jgi:hypothetical protein
MITISPFRIEATALRDRLKKRRFAAAVLADKKGDVAVKFKVDSVGECPHGEGESRRIHMLRQTRDTAEKRPG